MVSNENDLATAVHGGNKFFYMRSQMRNRECDVPVHIDLPRSRDIAVHV